MCELLFREDAYLKTASARVVGVHDRGIELDRTIFYPLGGGQMGDIGSMVRSDGERIAIVDTRKGDGIDVVLHIPDPAASPPTVGPMVDLEVDWARRHDVRGDVAARHRRHHNAGQDHTARRLK